MITLFDSVFESVDLRQLRVAAQGVLDGIHLLVETLAAFDPEVLSL